VKVETIQEKIAQGRYIISFTHTEKLRQRRIKAENIEQAIKTGTIIEDYPEERTQLPNSWVRWQETASRGLWPIGWRGDPHYHRL
jgi:Domain of unknown function (DUF4258)